MAATYYDPGERITIRETLWNTIAQRPVQPIQGNPVNLQEGTIEEIKAKLYRYVINNTNIYSDKKTNEIDNQWKPATPTPPFTNQTDSEKYNRQLDMYHNRVASLQNELKIIIDELSDQRVKQVLESEEKYNTAFYGQASLVNPSAAGSRVSQNQWLENSSNDLVKSSEVMRGFKKGQYSEILAKEYLQQTIDELDAAGALPSYFASIGVSPQGTRGYIFNLSDDERKELHNVLTLINPAELKKSATVAIDKKLTKKIDKLTQAEEKYETLSDSMKKNFEAEMTNINDEFVQTSIAYGRAKLNGGDGKSVKDGRAYKKVRGAIVRKMAAEIEMDYNNVTYDLEQAFQQIKADADADPTKKKDAVKNFEQIDGYLKDVENDVDQLLDEMLPSLYGTVFANSVLDSSVHSANAKKYLMINNNENRFTKKWVDGTYAMTGLGAYFDMFVGHWGAQRIEPNFAEKTWTFVKSLGRNRAPVRIQRARIPNIPNYPGMTVEDLGSKIVEKHKGASWSNNKKNKIEIDEVVYYGLGLAAEENGLEDIASNWMDVLSISRDSSASISDLLSVYTKAAELGGRINLDAAKKTGLRNNEFAAMDRHINKKAGFLYDYKDQATDIFNALINAATGKDKHKIDVSKVGFSGWTIDDTAIKPNKYAPIYTSLAIGGGAIATGALLYYLLTNNQIDLDKGIFHPLEVGKEILIGLTTALAARKIM